MRQSKFISYAACSARQVTFRDAVQLTRHYLQGLRELHADFRYWQFVGLDDRFHSLADDWHDLEDRLVEMARPAADSAIGYTELDANGNVTANTIGLDWFEFEFYTSLASVPPSAYFARPDYTQLTLRVGGRNGTMVQLNLPPERSDLHNSAFMRSILLLHVKTFDPITASVKSTVFSSAMRANWPHQSLLEARWFTYLRHPLVAACLPDNLPCALERLSDDEMLFQLTEHPPEADNDADVAKARSLQQFFDQLHFDQGFLLYGWPFDPAEEQYAQQITGAPAGTAYVVAFTAFDGYDSHRKVLLCARLFRGMENYGTTVGPWLRNDEARVSRLPIVALARQQLSALDYVGADTPVEWHVGIEAHARAIAILLNDIAGIPEKRLRVRYTPFVGALPPL